MVSGQLARWSENAGKDKSRYEVPALKTLGVKKSLDLELASQGKNNFDRNCPTKPF